MTLFEFEPNPLQNTQLTVNLDGADYTAIIEWNLFGERYYLTIYTLQLAQVLSVPLVGSPDNADINLIGGYFTSTFVYRKNSARFEVNP
jgi:hypothetical protein